LALPPFYRTPCADHRAGNRFPFALGRDMAQDYGVELYQRRTFRRLSNQLGKVLPQIFCNDTRMLCLSNPYDFPNTVKSLVVFEPDKSFQLFDIRQH
jgi:hypothetical protein